MVELMDITGLKSKEGEEKKISPKFNKKKNSEKTMQWNAPTETWQNYSGE